MLNAALAEADAADRGDARRRHAARARRAGGAGGRRSARRKSTAAGGFVYVRNAARGPWLVRYQYWEYVKNFMWRIGLAHLRVCLQVSGAFGAFRTRTSCANSAGSAAPASWRITRSSTACTNGCAARAGDYRVEVVPDAVAYTDSPDTVPSFVHQRTRWFAGFLQTLWEYRRMVGDPRMGRSAG